MLLKLLAWSRLQIFGQSDNFGFYTFLLCTVYNRHTGIISLSTDGVPDIKLVPGLKAYRTAVELYITPLLTPN